MPITVRSLADLPELGLREVVTAPADRSVLWAHATDLEDPSPYLQGGELLLTLGRHVEFTRAASREYVGRLVKVGVAGLGFGVGLGHPHIPEPLRRACRELGLALFEVPEPTPFIAVVRAVAEANATEARKEERWLFEAGRKLSRAAAEGGAGAVVAELARLTRRWVLLLDADGRVGHASGTPRPAAVAGLDAEIKRLLAGSSTAAANVSRPGETVVLQALGPGRAAQGVLVIGGTGPADARLRGILASATALVTLARAHEQAPVPAHAALLRGLTRLLLGGWPDAAAAVGPAYAELGFTLPAGPIRVVQIVTDAAIADDGAGLGPRPPHRTRQAPTGPADDAAYLRIVARLASLAPSSAASGPHGSPSRSAGPHGSPSRSAAPHGSPSSSSVPHGSPPATPPAAVPILDDGRAAFAVADADAEAVIEVLSAHLQVSVGVGGAHEWGELGAAWRQAEAAARRTAGSAPGTVARHGDDVPEGGDLESLIDHRRARQVAERRLEPLLAYDARSAKAQLVPTLGAWLEASCSWDRAAAALGVHRHTVRYRIEVAEELLGTPLADADTRFELWWACRTLRE